MSWLFSQALVEAYSEESSSGGAPSAQSSATHSPQAYCSPDRMTALSRLSRFGMTFAPLTESRGADVLTWFLAGFPAKTLAKPEAATVSRGNAADYGARWHESFARFSRHSRSWKTPQCSLLEGLDEFSETWPRWGLMRGGECWELTMPAHLTEGSESGLSADTPSGNWPTPTCSDAFTDRMASTQQKPDSMHSVTLAQAVRVWPTPTASDNRDRGNMASAAVQRRLKIGKQIGLSMAVKETADGGSLNPPWVEWLMGWPIGWTDCAASATDKFRQWCASHGKH